MTTPASVPKFEIESTEHIFSHSWKNTKAFKSLSKKETQTEHYMKNKSCKEVLELVSLNSKKFGSVSENIIQEILGIGARTSSQNDGTKNGKKIEIKCGRYWGGKNECKWQHLEPDHDYDYVIFALLDFQDWKIWGMKKEILMGEMRDKKIVTEQGMQGLWVRKSAIVSYLTPIRSCADFDRFIQS